MCGDCVEALVKVGVTPIPSGAADACMGLGAPRVTIDEGRSETLSINGTRFPSVWKGGVATLDESPKSMGGE